MTRVYYEEYEEVEQLARTPSGGQVNEGLVVVFSVVAWSMSSSELLQTTSSCVADKRGAALGFLVFLPCTLFWCGIDTWLNCLYFGLGLYLAVSVHNLWDKCIFKLCWNHILQCLFWNNCTSNCTLFASSSIISCMLHTGLLAQFMFVLICLGSVDLQCLQDWTSFWIYSASSRFCMYMFV